MRGTISCRGYSNVVLESLTMDSHLGFFINSRRPMSVGKLIRNVDSVICMLIIVCSVFVFSYQIG